MRVFVAGASGVLGRAVIPVLGAAGHDVIGLSRSPESGRGVERAGATAVQADVLDRAALTRVMADAAPVAVVHLATSIPSEINPRRMTRDFAQTNRIRQEGTRNLLQAARDVGAHRVVTQGLAWGYDPDGPGLADEDAPFWPHPPRQFAANLTALQELEDRTREAGGLVLRLGHVYGPGSIYADDGSLTAQVRSGQLPLVGGGTSVFSFTHAHDAATAITAAVDSDVRGALNIVDDEPAPMSEWVPVFADLVGARPPRRVPASVARLLAGSWGVAYLTRLRGADNAQAKARLGWQPTYASWRHGFAAELFDSAERAS